MALSQQVDELSAQRLALTAEVEALHNTITVRDAALEEAQTQLRSAQEAAAAKQRIPVAETETVTEAVSTEPSEGLVQAVRQEAELVAPPPQSPADDARSAAAVSRELQTLQVGGGGGCVMRGGDRVSYHMC